MKQHASMVTEGLLQSRERPSMCRYGGIEKLKHQLQLNFGPHKKPSFRYCRYREASIQNFMTEILMNVSSKLAEIDVFDTRTEQKYHHYRSLEMANPEC